MPTTPSTLSADALLAPDGAAQWKYDAVSRELGRALTSRLRDAPDKHLALTTAQAAVARAFTKGPPGSAAGAELYLEAAIARGLADDLLRFTYGRGEKRVGLTGRGAWRVVRELDDPLAWLDAWQHPTGMRARWGFRENAGRVLLTMAQAAVHESCPARLSRAAELAVAANLRIWPSGELRELMRAQPGSALLTLALELPFVSEGKAVDNAETRLRGLCAAVR